MSDEDIVDMWLKGVRPGSTCWVNRWLWHSSGCYKVSLFSGEAVLLQDNDDGSSWIFVCVLGGDNWLSGSNDWCLSEVLKVIKKREAAKANVPTGDWIGDELSASEFPELVEHLVSTKYADGSPRKTCTMTIMSQDRSWRAVLNDRDTGEGLWVVAESLQGLFRALEEALLSSEPHWKAPAGSYKKKK